MNPFRSPAGNFVGLGTFLILVAAAGIFTGNVKPEDAIWMTVSGVVLILLVLFIVAFARR
jgi:hypothetical protein